MRQVGDRVGAISHSDDDTVYIYGYGTYQGAQIPQPEDGVKMFGIPMETPNPCILLDNGKRVYGCECWWGPEAKIIATTIGKTVVEVDITESRKKAAEAEVQA